MGIERTYVKKPVELKAVQFTEDIILEDIYRFTNYLFRMGDDGYYVYNRDLDQWLEVEYGDYIARREGVLEVYSDTYFEQDFQLLFAPGGALKPTESPPADRFMNF